MELLKRVRSLFRIPSEEFQLVWVNKRDSCGSGESFECVDVVTKFSGVSFESVSFGSTSAFSWANSYDLAVDGTRYRVVVLDVDLGECKVLLIVSVVVLDVSTGRPIDDVSHLEAWDCLILGHSSTTLDASNHNRFALVLLASTVVSSLTRHF